MLVLGGLRLFEFLGLFGDQLVVSGDLLVDVVDLLLGELVFLVELRLLRLRVADLSLGAVDLGLERGLLLRDGGLFVFERVDVGLGHGPRAADRTENQSCHKNDGENDAYDGYEFLVSHCLDVTSFIEAGSLWVQESSQ